MAAAHGLSLYLDALDDTGQLPPKADHRILCEHHEDWVNIVADSAELVSAKHREPSSGAWTTVYQLASDGGIHHLFRRWKALDEKPSCRLVTNAGLSAGPVRRLERAALFLRSASCDGSQTDVTEDECTASVAALHQAFRRLAPETARDAATAATESPPMSPEEEAELKRFLAVLTFQHSLPTREYIGHAAPGMYAQPLLQHLRAPNLAAISLWEAVLGLFRVRMRAAGPLPTGALPRILDGSNDTLDPQDERVVLRRLVTLRDIDLAVRQAIKNPDSYRPLDTPRRVTRLSIKMAAGSCSDNSIERAMQLRVDYRQYWRSLSEGAPLRRASQEKLRRLILRISDQATPSNQIGGQAWGSTFWSNLQREIDGLSDEQRPQGLDNDVLLGGVCEMANQCKVWFSPSFDVQAEIDRIRLQRAEES
jgi:hypothetical protein